MLDPGTCMTVDFTETSLSFTQKYQREREEIIQRGNGFRAHSEKDDELTSEATDLLLRGGGVEEHEACMCFP